MSINVNQYSSSARTNFTANSLHTVATNNSTSFASKLNELNSNRVINRTAMNDPSAATVHERYGDKGTTADSFAAMVQQPGRKGRSRINPFDDTPDIETDFQYPPTEYDSPQRPYNPNPFHVESEKQAPLSEGPALISLLQLKKTRLLPQSSGHKMPLVFGAMYSPGQYVCQMMRCFALMIEPI